MNRYPNYTATNLPWLSEVPAHWETSKLRAILTPVSVKNHPDLPLLSVVRERGIIIRDVSNKEENHNVVPEDLSNYKVVRKKQFAMNKMKAWQGSYGISDYDGIVSPAYFVFDVHLDNLKFFHRAIRSRAYVDFFAKASGGIRVGQWDLDIEQMKEIPFFIPPRSEQDQIVRYLDWQTSRINGLIAAKRREIELLKEFKNAIVSYFVTHGLQNATIQKSEIYWLVGVPKSWRITKLKYVLQKHDRPIPDNASLLICSNNGEVKIRGDEKIGLVASNDDIYQGVAKGDLLIHGMDTWHGAIAISEYDGMCTPVVHVCTCTESKRFVAYYLKMMAYTKVFKAISNGIRQNTSDFRSWDKTGDLLIALPPIDEQEKISDLIDGKLTAINSTIEKCNKQISLLHELRTRLISDVVTGQIDVRGVTVPEFESIAEPPDDSAEEESAEYETEE